MHGYPQFFFVDSNSVNSNTIVLSFEDSFALEEHLALRSLKGTKTVLASLEELVWHLSGTGLSSEVLFW